MYAQPTAFDELGLSASATEREIKAAWRRLASQWHPDRNPSAEAVRRMQRINRAFDAIREAGFRNPVDWSPFDDVAQAPEAPEPAPPPEPPPRARPGAKSHAKAQAPEPPPEADDPSADDDADAEARKPILRRVKLTLEEAAAGCVKVLSGKLQQDCATCGGVGQTGPTLRCPKCRGSGQVRQHYFGWPGETLACVSCEGTGQVRHVCAACQGEGTATRSYQVKVRIPPGVRPGDRLHVPRRRTGRDAPPADLDISVEWQEHPLFMLDDDGTLRCEVPVDGFAWLAQQEVPVPTLGGPQPLRLRRDRLQYLLPGQGFPLRGRNGARPDQVVLVRPVFPENTSAEQDALLQQLIASIAAAAPAPLKDWQRRMAAWEKTLDKSRAG